MNVEIGTEAAQFLFWEINSNFFAVSAQKCEHIRAKSINDPSLTGDPSDQMKPLSSPLSVSPIQWPHSSPIEER
jgi:hypothetical protein